METALKEQLWAYISENNPDLMFALQERYEVASYLEEKVAAVMPQAKYLLDQRTPMVTVQEMCMEQMTEELKPSRYLYIKTVLEEEFSIEFEALQQSTVLKYEIINMMENCAGIFEAFGFTIENEEDRRLRHAIIAEIHDYLL